MRVQLERERKFLVKNDDWKRDVQSSVQISQIFLPVRDGREQRLRMEHVSGKEPHAFWITKEYKADGASITKLMPIPIEEAREFFARHGHADKGLALIEKTRYFLGEAWKDGWCVDVFHGPLHGLVVAEHELKNQAPRKLLQKPAWVDREVTSIKAYRNSSLAHNGLPSTKRDR